MHRVRGGRVGVINLIMKCMSKLNMLYHSGIPCFCEKKQSQSAKKPPETLDIIMQMWYNRHVVRGRRKYDMRRGRIKNRDKFAPLNKIRPTILTTIQSTSVIIIII